MLDKLKQHYQDAFILADHPSNDNYKWFCTEENTIFGIAKEALSSDEEALLATLFHSVDPQVRLMTPSQSAWYQFLYKQNNLLPNQTNAISHCRFIHFHTNEPIDDHHDFEIAIQNHFPVKVVVLWENDSLGIIIEPKTVELFEDVHFVDMIDTLIADFYVDFHLFIGQTYPLDLKIPGLFQHERSCFRKARQYLPKQKIYTIHDVILYRLLEFVDSEYMEHLIYYVLNGLVDEKEILETVKIYIESNLNVTNAAKKLYMHRNSLQYRIDKFIEKTGVDIKHFQGAFITYLAILSNEHFTEMNP